jgi:hypothetical protein
LIWLNFLQTQEIHTARAHCHGLVRRPPSSRTKFLCHKKTSSVAAADSLSVRLSQPHKTDKPKYPRHLQHPPPRLLPTRPPPPPHPPSRAPARYVVELRPAAISLPGFITREIGRSGPGGRFVSCLYSLFNSGADLFSDFGLPDRPPSLQVVEEKDADELPGLDLVPPRVLAAVRQAVRALPRSR